MWVWMSESAWVWVGTWGYDPLPLKRCTGES